MNDATEFDWGDEQGRGETWWRERAKSAGVSSELAIRFVVAKWRGCTNTEAARQAGAGGQATASGYRLSRSREVARLYSILNASEGDCIAAVDGKEARRILSGLARGSDPAIRIRAIEALGKLDEREAASKQDELGDGKETMRLLIAHAGVYGALAGCGVYLRQMQTLSGMPLADQALPLVRFHFSAAFAQMLASFPPDHEHHKAGVMALADRPVPDLSEFKADTVALPTVEAEADGVA